MFAWFLACGSKVRYVLLWPIFALRAKIGHKEIGIANHLAVAVGPHTAGLKLAA
jgi:hypothetical protein